MVPGYPKVVSLVANESPRHKLAIVCCEHSIIGHDTNPMGPTVSAAAGDLAGCGGLQRTAGSTFGVGDPAVADAGLRCDVRRRRRVVLQLLTELPDEHTQIVALLAVPWAPHLLEEPAVRQELARVRGHRLQEPVLRTGQVYR